MATITTKFAVGDVVYHASTRIDQKAHPCPDCLGTRFWEAKSPAGRTYKFGCPRCSVSFQSDRDLSLTYSENTPLVERRTIGSVRTDSYDGGVEYMCVETGVGSGRLYKEADLHETEDAASGHAAALAAERNASTEWIAKLYDKSLRLCDYEISDASLTAAREHRNKISGALRVLFEDLRDCEKMSDVTDVLDGFKFPTD